MVAYMGDERIRLGDVLAHLWQRCLKSVLRSGNDIRCLERALVLAGSSTAARRLAAAVENESGYRIRVAASAAMPGLPGAPSFTWIEDVIRNGDADRVLIADFEEAKEETNTLLRRLLRLAVDVTSHADSRRNLHAARAGEPHRLDTSRRCRELDHFR